MGASRIRAVALCAAVAVAGSAVFLAVRSAASDGSKLVQSVRRKVTHLLDGFAPEQFYLVPPFEQARGLVGQEPERLDTSRLPLSKRRRHLHHAGDRKTRTPASHPSDPRDFPIRSSRDERVGQMLGPQRGPSVAERDDDQLVDTVIVTGL